MISFVALEMNPLIFSIFCFTNQFVDYGKLNLEQMFGYS